MRRGGGGGWVLRWAGREERGRGALPGDCGGPSRLWKGPRPRPRPKPCVALLPSISFMDVCVHLKIF